MLGLPLIQRIIPIFDETPLKGAFTIPKKPSIALASVFDGSFQDAYNDYFEHTIGFRPLLVRINNQMGYSFFDTVQASGVIIGKNNYLFEINYIKAYKGWDYQGDSVIQAHAEKADFVHKKLAEAGKTLLFVLAPGKVSFFPEYVPDEYMLKPSGNKTNHQAFVDIFKEYGLPFVDFNTWFVQMKDTATFPLYPQCGIHWSAYGVALATDSLIHYIEKDRGIDMVDFSWNGFDLTGKLRDPDYDIGEGMNLLFKIPHYPMAYPRVKFGNEEGKTRPNVIVVADSYYWNIFGKGYSSRLFNDNNFWYYNVEAHNPEWPEPLKTDELDILEELSKTDVIIIMATEANLYRFPYGFIDQAYEAFKKNEVDANALFSSDQKEAEILQIMKGIDLNPEWKAQVMQKASDKKISYNEMLQLDAEWVWENKHK